MKNFKKALSVLLVTVMLLTAAPLSGFVGLEWPELNLPEWNLPDIDFNFSADAAEIVKSGSCGENLTWTLDSDGVLTISGTGEMTNYSYYSVPWYSNRSTIKVLSLSSSITNIGDYAFYGCNNLKTILVNDVEVIQPDEESSTLPEFPEEPDLPDEPEITTMPYEPDPPTDPPATEEFNEESQTTAPAASYFAVAVIDPEATTAMPTTEVPATDAPVTDAPATDAPITSQDPSFDLIDSDNRLPDSVTSIGDWAFWYCTSLTSVTIPDSVTSIGDRAFCDCTSLTDITVDADNTAYCSEDGVLFNKSKTELIQYPVGNARTSYTIPDSVTSIGNGAFYLCTKLTSVTIGNSVMSIGEQAFYYCTSLTSVTIPDSVTSIGDSAFYWCASLTSVAIGNSVTSIGDSAFYNCTKLTSVTIGNSVTSIGNSAFNGCPSLTLVTIPDSVTSIGGRAFSGCTSLTSVTIPDSVTSIGGYAFSHCSSLTDITVDADNTTYCSEDGVLFNKSKTELIQYPAGNARTSYTIPDSVTSIGQYAFYGCTSLTSVTIPDSVTSIGEYAFSSCAKLTSVHISDIAAWCNIDFDSSSANPLCYAHNLYLNGTLVTTLTIPDSVTSIGDYAFYYCTSLTSVTIPDSVTSIGDSAFNNTAYYNDKNNWIDGVLYIGSHLIAVDSSISDSYAIKAGTKSIAESAFEDCRSLTSVTIPDSVTSIGDYAFWECTSLTSVTIPDSVTSIGDDAFYYCKSLTAVHISDIAAWCNIDFDGSYANPLCYAHNLYLNGTLVTTLTIPDSVTSIGNDAFYNCDSLTSVTIPDSVTSIGEYAFSDCTSLPSVTIPDSVTSIGVGAFYGCTSLISVTIPDSVTSIGNSAFSWCTSLTSVTIGNSVTSIGNRAFWYCTSLISVTIGNSVTSIGDEAFYNCTSLTSVTIPDSVTSIGYRAFWYCTSLTSVTIGNSVTSIGDEAFYSCTSLTSVTIGDSVTSIGYGAFYSCTSLTDITVDADNTAYCSEDGVLFNKSKTELIQYPVGNARTSYTIPDSVTSIGDVAFLYCTSLPSVTIPDSVTSIGGAAFRGCTSLTSVTIGNSVTSIGIGAFYSCTSLTSVTIPDSVTSIEWNAFSDCTKLTSVTIPDSVTSIVNGAFSNCPALAIRGYLDSYAQQYAESNYIPFIVLNTDPFINLSGSSVTPTAEFTVYGFATPLQTVSLYCEDAVIGTATAGGNGRYTLTATLPAPEDGKTYTVIAKISIDGVDYESEPLQVTYNSDAATLNSLVFTHSCYDYTITPETLNFVAPIISINTNRPMYFTISLNGKTPDTLTVVSTKNGVRKTIPATYNAADGKWYASGWFDSANKSYVPGEITLEYDDGKVIEVPFKAKFIVDPSGYVYEAVKSNVVEDAIAIVQYKDENGNAAFWDADAYDQINPQLTKADGYFSWFVPEGEWQVKVVKDGYATAFSDWYTVPPEVTGLYIPLVANYRAEVDYCNVFADYAEIRFSQYMQIDSINSTNITFGEYTGTWEAVDKEVSGTDENVYYATTFRFTPDTAFSGDVTVNVANVTNYAGRTAYSYSPYTETVTVTAPIENFTLSATELTLAAGTQANVELDAGAAAAGKTVSVQFGNEAVASAVKTVTLDENGKASLTVNGNAFGVTTATFALAGTSLTAECTVTVTAPTAVEPAFTLGDVDNNGEIEAADARLALRAAVKLETLTEAQTQAADADKNGEIEAADARLILRAAVGLGTL